MQISRRDNLDRFYLFKVLGYGIFFHRIHHSEAPGVFHSHPWNGFSIIFGSYIEETIAGGKVLRRFFNYIHAPRHHRVEVSRPVGTLFFHGPRYNAWEVVDSDGKIIAKEPWRGIGGPTAYDSRTVGVRDTKDSIGNISPDPATAIQAARQSAKENS